MKDVVIYGIALIITLPFLLTYILYFLHLKIYNHSLKSFHFAVNWTTIFYMLAVFMMLHMLFKQTFLSYILLLVLIILSIIIYRQWNQETEVSLGSAIKLMWRICFLFFLASYIFLIMIGILKYIL